MINNGIVIYNGYIKITLAVLLSYLDSRKFVSIFLDMPLLEKQNLLADTQVFKLEADESFIEAYGKYLVYGIADNFSKISIVIKEA